MKYYFLKTGLLVLYLAVPKVKDKDYVEISDIIFGHRKNNG